MPLLLVRHGHAGRRSAYKGDDRLRPLSKRGVAQALALVPVLSGYRPRRILTSPYVRCSETVRPTGESLSLRVESLDELAEGHETETVGLVQELVQQPVVVCVHGDGSVAVLEWLVAAGGARPEQRRLQKGDVWVVAERRSTPTLVEHILLSERAPG
jgi:phosphohistidine phosphatase SixA